MPTPTRIVGGGVQVIGLDASIKGLRKVDPLLRKEAIEVMRKGAKIIQAGAQSRIGNHPSYRLGTQRGMIGRSVTSKGAGIKLRAVKYPWALSGEYGERVAHVYGRAKQQRGFKDRTAAPFKPPSAGGDLFKNKGGYWIQPTIRKTAPVITRMAVRELDLLFKKHLPGKVGV